MSQTNFFFKKQIIAKPYLLINIIFAFFPIFLTIILASFPSGLVVYWTVNNILTIAQQWVIMKKTKIKTN